MVVLVVGFFFVFEQKKMIKAKLQRLDLGIAREKGRDPEQVEADLKQV